MAERQRPSGASDAQRLAEIRDRWVPTRGKLHVTYDPVDAVNEAEADIDWLLEYVARMRTVGQRLRDISREATSFRHGSRVTAWDAEATEDEWDALVRGEEPSRA